MDSTDLIQRKQLTCASVALNILNECSKKLLDLFFNISFECSEVENTVNFWVCVSCLYHCSSRKHAHKDLFSC